MLTPQKIRVAFEYKKPERYQLAYESVVEIMRNTAIPRHKKLQAIGMTIDAAESGMLSAEKMR